MRLEEEVVCPSCGSKFRVERPPAEGMQPEDVHRLGKFELLEAVGRGAFGTVYRARDTELDRIVAVKVPRSGIFSTEEDEDRFVREARSAAQLQHAGVVPLFEVGRDAGFPYIVSQYVDGISLADALTEPPVRFPGIGGDTSASGGSPGTLARTGDHPSGSETVEHHAARDGRSPRALDGLWAGTAR